MAQRLILARHASTGASGRYIGASDLPLDEEGRRQAQALGQAVARRAVGRCLCSPLLRARQTAELAALAFEVDSDLREIDFGRWEGKAFDEIRRDYPEAVDHWASFAPDFAFPGGERLGDFHERIHRVAHRIAEGDADTVLAVTHGGVILALICHLLGLKPEKYVQFKVGNASLTTIELFDGKGVLSELNNCAHL